MKLITPPKLMPAFQRTAASGTLPIEQTKLSIATMGPMIGPQIAASVSFPSMKKRSQKVVGTHAAIAPLSGARRRCRAGSRPIP